MRVRRSLTLLAATALVVTVGAAPVAAQSDAAEPIAVIARDHHFEGLPASVPVGTSFTLVNEGAELHQLLVARRNDDVTESWEELLALPDEEALTKVTVVGQLYAAPGETSPDTLTVEQAGEYIALCFVPQGMTSFPGPDATLDPALEEALPHVALGMMQTFTVTAGEAAARTIDLELDAALRILQDGEQVSELPVTVGETITFRATNTAGYAHNLWIGTDEQLSSNQVDGLPGIPDFNEGTQEFTWTVPEDAGTLVLGCTVPGHYTLMKAAFVVAE